MYALLKQLHKETSGVFKSTNIDNEEVIFLNNITPFYRINCTCHLQDSLLQNNVFFVICQNNVFLLTLTQQRKIESQKTKLLLELQREHENLQLLLKVDWNQRRLCLNHLQIEIEILRYNVDKMIILTVIQFKGQLTFIGILSF